MKEENNPYDSPDYALSGFTGAFKKVPPPEDKEVLTKRFADLDPIEEEKSSTERVRRYYKRHPEKVRKYLRDTQDDRVQRNRDRAKAVKKHGKAKMKNHDVHHPDGPGNGWRLAKKDHGRDKKDGSPPEPSTKKSTPSKKPEKKTTASTPKKSTKKSTPKKPSAVKRRTPSKQDAIKKSIATFVLYAMKQLEITDRPTFVIIEPTKDMMSLGHYNPKLNKVAVVVKNRLLADILRTLAHELVHVKQMQNGQLTTPSVDTATGSPIENEANALAGVLMRNYAKMNKNIFLSEGLIVEGGAAGHLAHPFEDEDLSFADMKEMINRGLLGGLDQEAPVTEKLDGQNIAFTVRDGQIVFARNKSHVKNRGKNALDVAGIRQMFSGRGGIEKAFTGAAEDLQAAVERMTPEQIQQMFGSGSKFMSLEVILPDTQNVIPYGKSVLVMHGTIEYDEDGNEIGRSTTDGKEFADAVTAVGAEQQKTFGISGPKTIVFSDAETETYQQKAEDYSGRLDRVAQEFELDDKATLADYRRAWWERELTQQMQSKGIELSEKEFNGLVDRWTDGSKKFGVKDIENDETKKWFREFEKNELAQKQKAMIKPIETTFLQVGTDSLRRVTNFLSSNNPEASAQLKRDVLEAIKAIRDSDQPDKIAKLQRELERLEGMGIDNIVPSEGVVFIYNGKPYKFTGQFAPINQITGTFKFGMAPKESEEPKTPELTDIKDVASKLEFKPTTKQAKQYAQGNDIGDASDLEGMKPMSFAKNTVDGLKVVTVTADGKETENVAEVGDIIMSGPSGEQYVVKAGKFDKLYADGPNGTKIPEQSPRQVAAYTGTEDITFTAPWGQSMVMKPGDYLVKDGDGYYRVAKQEYEQTYNPPGTTETEPTAAEPTEPSAETPPKRTIAIFTGRFQPFHAGHYSIYEGLVEKFGKENVYIASSGKTDAIKSPFEFRDRQEIMTRMFDIPEEMIVQVKNPYAPVEILEKVPEDTTYVTAVSQKDSERLSGGKYFRNFDDVPEEERKGFKDQGYFIVAPEMQLSIDGKNISGTQLRAVMGDPQITDRAKQEIFTKVYGKFDQKIFDKIVKTTTESEEARKLTAQHGEPTKRGKKKPDEKAVKRAKSVLRQRVENPDTGRKILVATALTYPKEHSARKAAEALVQAAMQQNETMLMESKSSSENLKVYIYVKEHTEEELEHEIDEYFKNERTLKAFPNLADSSYELIDMIKKAPAEVLDINELKALENSDVGDILSGKNKTQILKQMIGNKKDVTGLLTDIKAKKPISMPVVIKHVSGYYLLGGNTRLSVLASLGHTMPVKVLGRAAPFDAPISVYPAKKDGSASKKKVNANTLFKSLLKMRITNPETGNEIKIDTAMDYNKEHPAHRAAMAVIRQRMRGLSNRAGIPKNRQD
jgi:hypothetical protein